MSSMPTFRVTVISRSVQAVNYKHRGGASKVDFAGTTLMPSANGQAKVESKKGYIEIEVEFGNLQKPTTFGNEYLLLRQGFLSLVSSLVGEWHLPGRLRRGPRGRRR